MGPNSPANSALRSVRTCVTRLAPIPAPPQTPIDHWTPDRGSHGVSDPSGRARDQNERAHRGRSRHGSCADRGKDSCSGRQRTPPHRLARRSLRGCRTRGLIDCWRGLRQTRRSLGRAGRDSRVKASGDDLIFRGRPPGRPLLWMSGDVNQGREMEVLPRQLDALDLTVAAVDVVGDDVRRASRKSVRGIVQPLPVQGSESWGLIGA